MKATFQTINRMRADGILDDYAIGGAVGALFYTEPSDTEDIDVFISFKHAPGAEIVSLDPIYKYLAAHGYTEHRKEGIVVETWPVQFLPTVDALDDEALEQAAETDLEGVPVRVMQPEHLAAIALRTGRGKDFIRILALVNSGRLDPDKMDAILKRHNLVEKWAKFEDKYINGNGLP
jgi:predicted nucleotidyltransferase